MLANNSIRLVLIIVFLSLFISTFIEPLEASKAGKVAKNVIKAGVLSGVGGKHFRPHHKRSMFPVWAIVLLVLGCSSFIGLGIFLFCFCRSRQFQSCLPRGSHV